jgi:hypothetical protein
MKISQTHAGYLSIAACGSLRIIPDRLGAENSSCADAGASGLMPLQTHRKQISSTPVLYNRHMSVDDLHRGTTRADAPL